MRPIHSLGLGLLLVVTIGCGAGVGTDPSTPPATPATEPVLRNEQPPRQSPSRSSATDPPSSLAPSTEPAAASRDDLPSRIVVAALGIDLPVLSGDTQVEGNPTDYPLCDVAQYLTTYRYPGRPGTSTWIYAHARPGMFLPLLEASRQAGGAELVGTEVDVYSTGSRRYRYRITAVHPHATDRRVAAGVPADDGRLILQTSEGPRGTVPKLQVAAVLLDVARADAVDAAPSAEPRECHD